MRKALFRDQQGVEPLVMKLMAGIILLAIGLGAGITVYRMVNPEKILSYTVTLSPSSATVGRPATGDNTLNVSLSVERLTDYTHTVTLSATGLPDNVEAGFSPRSEVPNFGSTMTVKVGPNAPPGTHTITIKATGADGTEKSTIFELNIE